MPSLRPPAGSPRALRAGVFRRPVTRTGSRSTEPSPDAARAQIIATLAERRVLWPLLPCQPCVQCALPRRPERARAFRTCFRCRELRGIYSDALATVHPITLTARDWALAAELRHFKDDLGAASQADFARDLGAVLSAYLQTRLTGTGRRFPAGPLITAVPSSRPVIAATLARAEREGWWVPALAQVAGARSDTPRQRERSGRERLHVRGKWQVRAGTVRDRDVLVLDDLYTTGGTAHSFALALREAGAASVHAVVLALNVGDNAPWILPALQARHAAGVRWHAAPSLSERVRR